MDAEQHCTIVIFCQLFHYCLNQKLDNINLKHKDNYWFSDEYSLKVIFCFDYGHGRVLIKNILLLKNT